MNVNPSIHYASVFRTLEALRTQNPALMSSWKLNIASKMGVSGSMGACLVRYLTGCDFSSLTQLAQTIFKNPHVSAQHKIDLANQLKELAGGQKAQIEEQWQKDPSNIKSQAKAKYFGKVVSKLDQVVHGENEIHIRPFQDKSSTAYKVSQFIRKWLLRRIFGLNIQEIIKITDYYLSNGKTKLSEDLKAYLDPSCQAAVPSNAILIKLDHVPTDSDLYRIQTSHQEALDKGESLIIRYQEENKPTFRIITPNPPPEASCQQLNVRFNNTTWQTILLELSEKVKNERKEIITQAFPLFHNPSLLEALHAQSPILDLNQTMKQLNEEMLQQQETLTSRLEKTESNIKKMADELGILFFRQELNILAHSSDMAELYILAWDNNGRDEERKFSSLNELKAFVNIKHFNHKINKLEAPYIVDEVSPQIEQLNNSSAAISAACGKIYISKKLKQQDSSNEIIHYLSYLDPISGDFTHKEINISSDEAFKEIEQFKQKMELAFNQLKEKEAQLGIGSANSSSQSVPCPLKRLNAYKIIKQSEVNPIYSIEHTYWGLQDANLFGWEKLQNRLKDFILKDFIKENIITVTEVSTHRQRSLLSAEKIGISREGKKFSLFRVVPKIEPRTLASVEIEDLDEDFNKGLERLNQIIDCYLENDLTNKTLKKVSSKTQVNVPPMPTDRNATDLSQLLTLYDGINFTHPQKPCYVNPKNLKDDDYRASVGDLREGLTTLIDHINQRGDHIGVPNSWVEKTRYYNILERYMRNIVDLFNKKLKTERDRNKALDAIQSHLLTLGQAGRHCGGRWVSDVSQLYNGLSGRWEEVLVSDDPETTVHLWIDQFKMGVVEELVKETNNEQSSHGLTYIRGALTRQGYQIPDAGASNYNDVLESQGRRGDARGSVGDAQVAKNYNGKMSSITFYTFLQDHFNKVLKSQNRDWVLNLLRDSINLTKEDKELLLKEKDFLKKKDDLLKLKKHLEPLTNEEIRLLTRTEEIKNNPQLITKLQWIYPDRITHNEELKKEIIELKEKLSLLVGEKPYQLEPYKELLKNRGYELISIQDQLNTLTQAQETKRLQAKDQKLKEKGLLVVIQNRQLGCEEIQLSVEGVAFILRHLGFIEQKPEMRRIESKPYYHGILKQKRLERLLDGKGKWLIYRQSEDSQPIVAKRDDDGEISFVLADSDILSTLSNLYPLLLAVNA